MGTTSISWTNRTWNPVTGCTQIPSRNGLSGCDNCYAKRLLGVRHAAIASSPRYGLPFETVLLHENRLSEPLHLRKPALWFVNSVSDVFHESVNDAFIARMFGVMVQAKWHTFQVLTKRPERMRRIVRKIWNAGFTGDTSSPFFPVGAPADATYPAPNVWLGVSIATDDDAWRANMLRETPAAIRFISAEPLLGPIPPTTLDGIDWVIVGAESAQLMPARPMELSWVRDIIAACRERHVAVHVKQLGSIYAKQQGIRGKADKLEDFPPDLRIREYPGEHVT